MPEDAKLVDKNVRDELKRDFNRSYLVDAGAGTGKTTVLVERLVGAVEKGCELSKVAAVTFTEKAAGELVMRVRRQIEERINNAPSEAGKWKNAREQLEQAYIGTIHSFCASLLRKRPIEAGVDPNFEVADEVKSRTLREEAWKEWIRGKLDEGPPVLKILLREGVGLGDMRKMAFDLAEKRDVLQAHFIECPSGPELPELDIYMRKLRRLIENAKQFADEYCKKPDNDRGVETLLSQESALKEFHPEPDDNFALLPLEIEGSKGNKTNWKPQNKKDEFAGILAEIELLINEYNSKIKDYLAHSAVAWLYGFTDRYRQIKEREGVLDFEDLLIKARDMLYRKDVRRYFQGLFDLILVDEFQDTDPLQVEVALLLSEAEPEADEWRRVKPKDGKLFIVGDPKQSIYRFRRADIHTYLQVRNFSEKVLSRRELAQNFRSAKPLMDFFNSFFDEHFNSNSASGGEIGYTGLEPPPAYSNPPDEQAHPGVVGIEIKTADLGENPKAEKSRETESKYVARFIARAINEGRRVRTKSNEWRPISYGDIAVLFRKRTGLHYFSEELRKLGVPYVAPGAAGLFSQPESRSVLSCLMAIDRPDDGAALVGALRSPFFGFTDESIAMARLNGVKLDYTIEPDSEKFPRPARAFEILRELHRKRNELSKARIISRLLEETGAIALYSGRDPSRMATISKFRQMARDFDYSLSGSLRAFIEYLLELESESQAEEAAVESEESDAVSLMTVHGAKGLEFPMVILGDMSVSCNFKERLIIDRRDKSFSVKLGNSTFSSDWEERKKREKKELEQEEARLLYVACTRARDYLVVPMPEEGKPGKFTAPLIAHIREKWRDKTYFPELSIAEAIPVSEPDAIASKGTSTGVPEGIASLEEWKEYHNDTTGKLSRPSRFNTVTGLKPEAAAADEKLDLSADSYGKDFGIFVHRLMEKTDFSQPRDIEALAKRLSAGSTMTSHQLRAAVEMARRALELHVIKRAASSKKVKREFLVMVKSEGGEMISGVVDIVFEEGGKLVLADYKTDAVGNKEEACKLMEATYNHQGLQYAKALEKATGMEVSGAFILFLHPSPAIELECK